MFTHFLLVRNCCLLLSLAGAVTYSISHQRFKLLKGPRQIAGLGGFGLGSCFPSENGTSKIIKNGYDILYDGVDQIASTPIILV